MTEPLRANTPDVVAETVDGEALIVNLRTGCYYTASGAAEAVWSLLCGGETTEAATRALAAQFDGDGRDLSGYVAGLRAKFLDEELLVAAAGPGDGPVARPAPAARQPFLAETLTKFTDMQELLILDPVHDVEEEAGWPAARRA